MFKSKLGPAETRMWMGIRFYRYPEAPRNQDRKYFKAGRIYLHVLVWIFAHGRAVPDGCHVHHIDGDTGNNEPENLEAMDALEHTTMHNQTDKNTKAARQAHAARIRPLARDWHSSPEGIAWHVQQGRRQVRPLLDKVCTRCGVSFQDKNSRKGNTFCSALCRTKWYYAEGRRTATKTCLQCGKVFERQKATIKPGKNIFCSRACFGVYYTNTAPARRAANLRSDD